MRLSNLLKDAREKAGLSQEWVSRELGLTSGQFMSNVERGIATFPMKHASRISKLLRISVASIIDAKTQDQRDELRRKVRGATPVRRKARRA